MEQPNIVSHLLNLSQTVDLIIQHPSVCVTKSNHHPITSLLPTHKALDIGYRGDTQLVDWAGLSVTEGGVLTPVSSGPCGAVTGEGAVSVGTAATREARSCTEREREEYHTVSAILLHSGTNRTTNERKVVLVMIIHYFEPMLESVLQGQWSYIIHSLSFSWLHHGCFILGL